MIQSIQSTLDSYAQNFHMPVIRWSDILEILIIAFLLYHIMLWLKNTRAWVLLRGLIVILVFVIFAAVFNMTTILWIVQNVTGIAVIAIIIILQPELRSALEELGQRNLFKALFPTQLLAAHPDGRFKDQTINEIIRASYAMGRAKTGALIVVEHKTPLQQYERTGIDIDGVVTRQLLINIFEKNTPLHDGAVIIRGDRVVSATCYLPLSENRLDKDLGTRHRAGLGISEVTDSLTIIVSEETGNVSLAYKGHLYRNVGEEAVRERLLLLQDKPEEKAGARFSSENGESADKSEKTGLKLSGRRRGKS